MAYVAFTDMGDIQLQKDFHKFADLLKKVIGEFNKIDLKLELVTIPVKNKDKEIFFDHIEDVNQIKYPKQTKKSITFPKSKEFFLGAMPWGNNFALMKENQFVLISDKGNLIKKINFPAEINVKNQLDFTYPERRLYYYNDYLYYYDENEECLKIFQF